MGFSDRHNKGSKFNIDIEGFTFKNLSDLYSENGKGTIYQMNGFYINTKGKFDAHPVAICSDMKLLIDLPSHLTDDFISMLQNKDDLYDIRNGEAQFIIEPYTSKQYDTECFGIRWV